MIKLSGHFAYGITLLVLFLALGHFEEKVYQNKALEVERYCYGVEWGLVVDHNYAPKC